MPTTRGTPRSPGPSEHRRELHVGAAPIHPPYPRYPLPRDQNLSLPGLLSLLGDTADADQARDWSKYYASGPHLAGKNYSHVEHTWKAWESFGIPSDIVEYLVYINYPAPSGPANLTHGLALVKEDATRQDPSQSLPQTVLFQASLEEDVLPEDSYSQLENRPPTFHGYSASGNVTAPFVYGGYCDEPAFEELERLGVPVRGHIVVCRYGFIFRGLKVKGAQDRGAVGVVIFTDPADDHPENWAGGGQGDGKPYPQGSGRQPSSVQRGSVQFLSLRPGDPTTPGYASKPGVERSDPYEAVPKIPSLPISYVDAVPILKALNGWGQQPKAWKKGGLEDQGVEYWTGPVGINGTERTLLNLFNNMDAGLSPIWDVIGVINGSISDEVIVIGNHHDAWCAGAGDPVSGSAALMELARAFGEMLKHGWKPLRTIILASWDGEEYGLVGSTEWVEEHRAYLMKNAVAYINVDVAVAGSWADTSAAPLMYKVLTDSMKRVKDPLADKKRHLIEKGHSLRTLSETHAHPNGMNNNGVLASDHRGHEDDDSYKGSVYEIWRKDDGVIRSVGSGSDFTGFQDMAMIPIVDFSFRQGAGGAVYHYHSNYDSFDWMRRFGDPGFTYHRVATNLLGNMALQLSETPVIPFNLSDYANFLSEHTLKAIDFLDKTAATRGVPLQDSTTVQLARNQLHHLLKRTYKLQDAASVFDAHATALAREITELSAEAPWWKRWFRAAHYWARVKETNRRIQFFERNFGYEGGLDGREVFKHVVFAPGLWTGYSGVIFPGIAEGIEVLNYTAIEKWTLIVAKCVDDATESILWDRS
ncbi:hypothetical protein DRE_01508 [Drechslerella stenobrocha 248]|uniref:Glutamate carboxypeptidase n=1 Tax=Drechslerella stenobrocha 248 TaxID=1043628 RepID=W7HIC0_9PEZI|nr:hypothetical protein DRE_01508 [Drechslerella stenobrocha 248]